MISEPVMDVLATIIAYTIMVITSIVVVTLYLLPFIVAKERKHKQIDALLAANILTGWTGIGWVACMIWAHIK